MIIENIFYFGPVVSDVILVLLIHKHTFISGEAITFTIGLYIQKQANLSLNHFLSLSKPSLIYWYIELLMKTLNSIGLIKIKKNEIEFVWKGFFQM